MLERILKDLILSELDLKKIVLILGARQVGKTTLLKQIQPNLENSVLWLNGDEPLVRKEFENAGLTKLKQLIGQYKVVLIDEAQRIPNIRLALKIIYDNLKDVQVFVTGSSALYLSDKIKESLAGRKIEYHLYPFSYEEIQNHYGYLEAKANLEFMLTYGNYPEVFTKQQHARTILLDIVDSYLFKDVFQLYGIKRPELIEKLTQALALQIGQEISYNEIANLIDTTKDTVQNYISLLEQNFIVFRLPAYSSNLRREIKRSKKVYFWDIGIRNAVIENFTKPDLRPELGHIWENFLISQRLQFLQNHRIPFKAFFWRTVDGQEVDYIERRNGQLYAYEFKWNPKRSVTKPKSFLNKYPEAVFSVITQENFVEFLTEI